MTITTHSEYCYRADSFSQSIADMDEAAAASTSSLTSSPAQGTTAGTSVAGLESWAGSRSASIGTMWSSAEVPIILDAGAMLLSDPTKTATDLESSSPAPDANGGAAEWINEDDLHQFLQRHRTPPPRHDVPMPCTGASPPWHANFSPPPKSLSSKGKKRPPALQLQQTTRSSVSSSGKQPHSAPVVPEQENETPSGKLPSHATEPNLNAAGTAVVTTSASNSPSRKYRQPKGYFNAEYYERYGRTLFDPNYSMSTSPAPIHPRVHSAVKPASPQGELQRLSGHESNAGGIPPDFRYSASLSSSEGSSHGTDSGDVRTPQSAHMPLALTTPYDPVAVKSLSESMQILQHHDQHLHHHQAQQQQQQQQQQKHRFPSKEHALPSPPPSSQSLHRPDCSSCSSSASFGRAAASYNQHQPQQQHNHQHISSTTTSRTPIHHSIEQHPTDGRAPPSNFARSPRSYNSHAQLSTTSKATQRPPNSQGLSTSPTDVQSRVRSCTLGSVERPHTSNAIFDSAAVHHHSGSSSHRHASHQHHAKQRSVDVPGIRHKGSLDKFGVGAATSSSLSSKGIFPSPTTRSFTTESASIHTEGRTPRTPRSSLPGSSSRPKSTGGWAAHLSGGLHLRIEREGQEAANVSMQYMAYDPFGKPESLVTSSTVNSIAGNNGNGNNDGSRPGTPKRPRSKNSKDDTEECIGLLHFKPDPEAKPLIIRYTPKGPCPVLRHLAVADDVRADLLTRQASLTLAQFGVHEASGFERKGRLAWRFRYEVLDFGTGTDGSSSQTSLRILKPIGFTCSAMLLDPERARKSRLIKLVKKQIVPQIIANPIASRPATDSSRPYDTTSHDPESLGEAFHQRQSEASSGTSTPSWIQFHQRASNATQPTVSSAASQETSYAPSLVPFKIARSKISRVSLRSLSKMTASTAASTNQHQPAPQPQPSPMELRISSDQYSHLANVELSPRSRPRTIEGDRARPATASELIKQQYLARFSDNKEAAISHRQVFGPDAFSNVDDRARRYRLRTAEAVVGGETSSTAFTSDTTSVGSDFPDLLEHRHVSLGLASRFRPRSSQVAGE